MKFYFITAFASYDMFGTHTSRCWGFYNNFIDADIVVRNNITDLWEYTYDYIVIEEYEMGISNVTLERWFYKFNKETKKYEPMDEPEALKHYSGFAIG